MSINARLSDILAFADPWKTIPWRNANGLTRELVVEAIKVGNMGPDPVGFDAPLERHVARIAWLVVNGWVDTIQVDVGCPSFPGWRPTWPITDGNHRLPAAAFRGDDLIELEWGGEVARARRLLGADLIDADVLRMEAQAALDDAEGASGVAP